MTRTLLVEISIEDPGVLPELALEVQDILNDAGLSVTSVKPWQGNESTTPTLTTGTQPTY